MAVERYGGDWPDWTALTGEIIAQRAKECAWPYGQPKNAADRKYPTGKPYGDFTKALNMAHPNRSGWGKQCQKGASCDVAASTIVRYSGYDKKVPRGLGSATNGQYKHFKESSLWRNCKAYKYTSMKPGDYILYANKKGGGHACIYIGDGYSAEAGFPSKRYMQVVKAKNYDPKSKKSIGIYRATKPLRTCVKRGDHGEQVRRVQNFLTWVGLLTGTPDGKFGPNTERAVKEWQTMNKLEADGSFGRASLKAAQQYTKHVILTYDGKYPTLPKTSPKCLQRGSKGQQVIYLQEFLNWYDSNQLIRDGKFGPLVEKAVKSFQKKEGLKVDGKFGPASLAKAKKVKR